MIAAELSLPEAIVEHRDSVVPRLIVAGQQTSAERELQAEQVEQTIADADPSHFARFAGAEHRVNPAGKRLDLIEHSRLLAHAHEIRWRERVWRAVWIKRRDAIQPWSIAVGQRREQHGLDDAEDRAVGANAERQRSQCDDGEARRAVQHAPRVADILP